MAAFWREIGRGERRRWGIAPVGDVEEAFAAHLWYRLRLGDIVERMESVKRDWSRHELSGSGEAFRRVRDQSADLEVPPGCERAQRALLYGLKCYEAALAQLRRAAGTEDRADPAAWGYVKDGDVLLTMALDLADGAQARQTGEARAGE